MFWLCEGEGRGEKKREKVHNTSCQLSLRWIWLFQCVCVWVCVCVCVCACVFDKERERERCSQITVTVVGILYIFFYLCGPCMCPPSLFGLLPTVLASETCIFVRYFYSEVHTRTHMLKNNQIFCLSILSKFVSNWLVSLLSNFFRFKSVKQSSDAITNISWLVQLLQGNWLFLWNKTKIYFIYFPPSST